MKRSKSAEKSPAKFKFLPEYGGQFACGDASDPRLIGVVRTESTYHSASGDVNGGHGHGWGYNTTKSYETPEEALIESLSIAIRHVRAVVRHRQRLLNGNGPCHDDKKSSQT